MDWSYVDYLWIIVMLSGVWKLILMAPISVVILHFSISVSMKNQTNLYHGVWTNLDFWVNYSFNLLTISCSKYFKNSHFVLKNITSYGKLCFFAWSNPLKHERVVSFSLVVRAWLNISALTGWFTYCLEDGVELSRWTGRRVWEWVQAREC